MEPIKPIETAYKGYRFRSRTEARWAVFFYHLGIQWQYEIEGYKLPCGFYLPDFWLLQVSCFAEVKASHFTADEATKCLQLSMKPECEGVLLLDGPPDEKCYLCLDGAGFEHGCWDVYSYFYELSDSNSYWIDEHRFYSTEGGPELTAGSDYSNPRILSDLYIERIPADDSYFNAVKAARSARFEHGESPK